MVERNDETGKVVGKHTVFVSIEGEAATLTAECDALETIARALEALAKAHGRQDLSEFAISVENADEQTVATTTVGEALHFERRGRLHLHRCHRVTVSVQYNGKTLTHEFSPASTVHRVLSWAVGPHSFDVESDAHDLVLQLSGTTVPLAPNVHVGTLLRERRCELALELVPKDRQQG